VSRTFQKAFNGKPMHILKEYKTKTEQKIDYYGAKLSFFTSVTGQFLVPYSLIMRHIHSFLRTLVI